MRNSSKARQESSDRRRTLLSLTFFAFVLSFFCSGVGAGELPRPAAFLPAETVLLVEVSNFSELVEQFKKTNYYKLYKDPAMASLIEDIKSKLHDEIKKSQGALLSIVMNGDTLPSGKAAIAVVPGSGGGFGEPEALVMAEWGDAKGKVQEGVDKALARAVEEGSRKTTENYRGVDIITVVDEGKGDLAPSYCFLEDCFIGSTNIDLLKSVIARIKGGGGACLGDEADYNAAINAVGPHHDIDVYVNLKQLKELIIAEAPIGQAGPIVSNLGFDNVISFSFAAGVGRQGSSGSSGKAFIRVDGEKKGVCKMLEFDSTGLGVPKFAPSDFYSSTYVNFNFKKAFDTLGRIITSISPQMAAILYMPLVPPSPDGKPGLTLKADIIDHLGSQLVSFRSLDKSASVSAGLKPRVVVALATNNRGAIESSLSRVHGLFSQGNPDASRSLLGHTIYTIDLSAFLGPFMPTMSGSASVLGQSPGMSFPGIPKLAFTVTETHVVMGLEAEVEGAVRKLSSAAGDLPRWFRKAKAGIPDVVGMASLQDDSVAAEVLWDVLSEAAKEAKPSEDGSDRSMKVGVGTSGLSLSQAGLDFMDAKLLPEFEAVRKYFGISAIYGIAREDGFFFESKYISLE